MIRFHLDEHVSSAVARGLRKRGIDVTTTTEAGLQDAEDVEHVQFATRQRRVIVTQDQDFLRIHAQGMQHNGIVYCRQQSRSIGQIVQYLELLSHCLDQDDMDGRLEYM